jgi:hypothetical protein
VFGQCRCVTYGVSLSGIQKCLHIVKFYIYTLSFYFFVIALSNTSFFLCLKIVFFTGSLTGLNEMVN